MPPLQLSPGQLVFQRWTGLPLWPCRVLSWDPQNKIDPMQAYVEKTLYDKTEEEKETLYLLVYLGPIAEFGVQEKDSEDLVPWEDVRDALRGAYSETSGRVDYEALRAKHGKENFPYEKDITDKTEADKYPEAVKDALEWDEKGGNEEWVFGEYMRMKGLDRDGPVVVSPPAPMETDDPREAMRRLAAKKRKQDALAAAEDAALKREAWSPGQEDAKDEEYRERKKKKREAHGATPERRKRLSEISVSVKPGSSSRTAQAKPEGPKVMTLEEFDKYFDAVKTILAGQNMEKKAKYQQEIFSTCEPYLSENIKKIDELNRKIKKAEEARRVCEEDVRGMTGKLKLVSTDLVANADAYSLELLTEGLVRKVRKFMKGAKPYLSSEMGKGVSSDLNSVLSKWREKFGAKPKPSVTLSPKEGDFDREQASNTLGILAMQVEADSSLGIKIEEELFGRHGVEGRSAYERDFKLVYAELKGEGRSGKKTFFADITQGKLTVREFVDLAIGA